MDEFWLVVLHLWVRVKGSIVEVAYEFVLSPPAMSRMSCSSNLDGLRNGW